MFHQRTQFGSSTVAGQHWVTGGGSDIVTGLVSRWMFSEGTGTTVADSAPVPKSNITIVPGGSSVWSTGSYFFDGSTGTSYGHAPDNAAYNFGTALTVFGWVKVAASGGGGFAVFGQYDFGTTPAQRSWAMFVAADNQRHQVVVVDGTSQALRKNYIGTAVVYGDDTWHSVGFTWNGSVLKLYVDGLPDAVSSLAQDDAVGGLQNGTSELSFAGLLNNNVISNQLPISLQRIYLYNVVKTAADFVALHALGHGA